MYANSLSTSPLSQRSVLVVDDDEDERLLLFRLLTQLGCRVYVARDGADGYAKAQVVTPYLILMDVLMPVLGGIESCRRLKANPHTQSIPVIFLSVAGQTQERVAGLSAGAVDYVTKPFDFDEVRLRLCVHLKTPPEAPTAGDTPPPLPGAHSTLDTTLFQAARRLLLQQLGHTPDLTTLANSIGTHPRRLQSAFKQCAGVTVIDFLREERLKEARRLLTDTDLDIQTIARELGYGHVGNFSTAFRERFDLTPREFRKQRHS